MKKRFNFQQRSSQWPQRSSPRGVPIPRLATLRRQQGLSQAEPAERAGDGVSTISRLERGANARYGAIDLLATALGISRERLIKLLRRGRHNGLGERNSPSQEDHEEGK